MPFNTMAVENSDNVAIVTINRPDAANAIDAQMAAELREIATVCSKDDTIRAVLITALGKMFCAGGDLTEVHSAGATRVAHMKRMATDLHAALELFANMDAPVVVAVNGTAAGASFSLVLSGDYVISLENARFVSAYTAAGLTPDGSSSHFIAKHVGLLGEGTDADEPPAFRRGGSGLGTHQSNRPILRPGRRLHGSGQDVC